MSNIQVPISKVIPGMYLVKLSSSASGEFFKEYGFLMALQYDIDALIKDGVKVVQVDTEKSTVSCEGIELEVKATAPPVIEKPIKKEVKEVEFSIELKAVKQLRKDTVKRLKNIFLSSIKGGPLKQDEISSIVGDSHDSILRNSHASLAIFHNGVQKGDLENHSFNVMSLAIMLGERAGLSDNEIDVLGSAALLMDVGWRKLSPDLFSTSSTYTDDEFNIVKSHVDISVEILEKGNIDSEVVGLVAKHHERIDGSGYFSYQGEADIPLMCRILSIADHYNSRVRGYYDRPSMIPSSVLKEIYAGAKNGSHDARLTQLLVQLVGIYPVSSVVQLNTKEKGVVTKINWRDSINPTVTVYYDRKGIPLPKAVPLDLSKQDKSSPKIRKIHSLVNLKDLKSDPANVLSFVV